MVIAAIGTTTIHGRAAWNVKNPKMANMVGVSCSYSTSSLNDQYRTLKVQPGASESEIKKAFRSLALQYHPDVCKGSNCGVQFHQINEAYDMVMSRLRGETERVNNEYESYDQSPGDEPVYDPDWDMWEEWMGWEGAGICFVKVIRELLIFCSVVLRASRAFFF